MDFIELGILIMGIVMFALSLFGKEEIKNKTSACADKIEKVVLKRW